MKAAPEGVVVFELNPASAKLIAFYRDHIAEFGRVSDALSYPRFSKYCLNELTRIVRNVEAPDLIQAAVRMGKYTDHNALILSNMEVSKLLRVNYGIRLPRGKRPRPGMVKLVSQITPILLYYGLPCRTSESSRLVLALQLIADEIKLEGDPRDELRRLKKIQTRHTAATKESVYGAIARGLMPQKLTDAN